MRRLKAAVASARATVAELQAWTAVAYDLLCHVISYTARGERPPSVPPPSDRPTGPSLTIIGLDGSRTER